MISFNNHKKRHQAAAIMCAAVMVLAATAGIAVMEDEESIPTVDAIAPVIVFAIAMFLIAIASTTLFLFGAFTNQGSNDQTIRDIEGGKVAEYIAAGLTHYRNALNVYLNTWALSEEHFIRTAEIIASSLWAEDKEYVANDILEDSGAYMNVAYMLQNSAAQVGIDFHALAERLSGWNNLNLYSDKMTLDWVYGTTHFGSKSSFDGWLQSVAEPSGGKNKAYISGGDLWTFGGASHITSSDGVQISVPSGHIDLDSVSNFEPGIYIFDESRQYAGNFTHVIDSNAVTLTSGIVMMAGNDFQLAVYNNQGRVTIDGSQYDALDIWVKPDDGTASIASIHSKTNLSESILAKYIELQHGGDTVLRNANLAASTAWNIFDRAGAASSYLTTLMVPDNYQNVALTGTQQELITTIALIDLKNFTQGHEKELTADDFQLTTDSMSLFVRGDIRDHQGNNIYENVIFTPFYYVDDETLTIGNNIQDQPALIAIWDAGSNLSSWSFTSNTQVGQLTSTGSGDSIYIYEILYSDNFVNSVDLDVKNIDIIDMEKLKIYIPDPPLGDSDIWGLISTILLILGILAIALVPLHKNLMVVIGGVICIVISVVLPLVFGGGLFGGIFGGLF